MHTLFLLNPAAGKADCTRTLPQQIAAAAAGAGLAPEDYTIRVKGKDGKTYLAHTLNPRRPCPGAVPRCRRCRPEGRGGASHFYRRW